MAARKPLVNVAGALQELPAGDTIDSTTTGSAAKLTTGRTINITGEATWSSPLFDGSADVTAAITFANTTVAAGSYGSATQVPTYTVDAKGRLTAASNTSIQIAESQVTNLTTDLGLKAPLASPTFTGTVTTPNLAFNTASGRITGDFSNATYGSRVAFQTSTTNGNTTVQFLPNGTGAYAALNIHNTSDLTNLSLLRLESSSSTNRIASISGGTGTSLPLSLYTNGADRLTIDTSGNSTFTGTVTTPNLAFNTAGGRITGDFTNATVVNRVLFQSSTANGNTSVGFLPNGTATSSNLNLFGGSDTSNCSLLQLVNYTTGGFCALNSTKIGTGVTQPIQFQINGSSALTIDTSGNSTFTGTVSGSSATGFRNKIINGDFQIWQGGTSFTNPTSNATAYCADQWQAYRAGFATNITVSKQQTQASNPGIRVQRNSGDTSTALLILNSVHETIENNKLLGKVITAQFKAKCGANFSATSNLLGVYIVYGTGTDSTAIQGFTAQSTLINYNANLTTSLQQFSFTTTLPSNATQFTLWFQYAPTGTAGANDWFEITDVQLEEGSVATPFERRPYGLELSLCQRYYQQFGQTLATEVIAVGQAYATSNAIFYLPLKATMRAAPTIAVNATSNFVATNSGFGTAALSSLSSYTTTQDEISLIAVTSIAFLVAGNMVMLLNNSGGAGRIYASARL